MAPESSMSSLTVSDLVSPLSPTQWLEGSSPAIIRLRTQILRVAPFFRMALLVGERDTGQEAAARMLHQLSPLGDKPFVSLTPNEIEVRMAEDPSFESLECPACST